MIVNCFRYLGFTSLQDIKTLSLFEYEARMYAFKLQQIDREHEMYKLAWLNNKATAVKEQGDKLVSAYKSFKDFYDYEARLKEAEIEMTGRVSRSKLSPKLRKLAQIAKKLNEGG